LRRRSPGELPDQPVVHVGGGVEVVEFLTQINLRIDAGGLGDLVEHFREARMVGNVVGEVLIINDAGDTKT